MATQSCSMNVWVWSLCCSEVKTDKCNTDGKDRKSVRKSTGADGGAEEQTQSRLNKEVEDFPPSTLNQFSLSLLISEATPHIHKPT